MSIQSPGLPFRRLLLVVMAAIMIVAASCSSDDAEDASQTTSSADEPTIWVPARAQVMFERLVTQFEHDYPEVRLNVEYAPAADLNDRILVGERPDAMLSSARDLEELATEQAIKIGTIDLAKDQAVIIVPPGNPGQISELSSFGADSVTTVGLCGPDLGCGRIARNVLIGARITPLPDVTATSLRDLTERVGSGELDAGIVLQSSVAKPLRDGLVEAVQIPSPSGIEIVYRLGILRPGAGLDKFVDWLRKAPEVGRIVTYTGLTPIQEDQQ